MMNKTMISDFLKEKHIGLQYQLSATLVLVAGHLHQNKNGRLSILKGKKYIG